MWMLDSCCKYLCIHNSNESTTGNCSHVDVVKKLNNLLSISHWYVNHSLHQKPSSVSIKVHSPCCHLVHHSAHPRTETLDTSSGTQTSGYERGIVQPLYYANCFTPSPPPRSGKPMSYLQLMNGNCMSVDTQSWILQFYYLGVCTFLQCASYCWWKIVLHWFKGTIHQGENPHMGRLWNHWKVKQ